MIILTYDIHENNLRTEFSKFILAYGRRLQFSVYEIENSKRILNIVKIQISEQFEKRFEQSDSVYIFEISDDKITRFGYAKNEESDIVSY